MKFIYLQLKYHEFIHVFYNYIIQIANKLFVHKKITNEKNMYTGKLTSGRKIKVVSHVSLNVIHIDY